MTIAQFQLATAERERLLAEPDAARLSAQKPAIDATIAAEVEALRSILSRPLDGLSDVAAAAGILRDLISGGDWEDYHAPLAARIARDSGSLAKNARGDQNNGSRAPFQGG